MSLVAVDTLIDEMAVGLSRLLEQRGVAEPAMVGIHTGGAWIADALHKKLQLTQPLGLLDITFYRDDFTRKGLHPSVKPSQLPFVTEDQHIILVDDEWPHHSCRYERTLRLWSTGIGDSCRVGYLARPRITDSTGYRRKSHGFIPSAARKISGPQSP